MPQMDYSIYQPAGFEGQVATGEHYRHIEGTFLETVNNTTAYIPFGRIVVEDGGKDKAKLPSATGQTVLGVTVATKSYEKAPDGSAGYPPEREIAYMVKGTIYMVAEEAVAPTDTVYFRHTASGAPGAYDAIGRVRNDADTATADALLGAKFLKAAGAGEVVPVKLDL